MTSVDACGGCGRPLPPGAERCKYCGRGALPERLCPHCERPIARNATRCLYCGPIREDEPVRRAADAPSYREPPPRAPGPSVVEAPPGAGKLSLLETRRSRLIAAGGALLLVALGALSCVAYWPAVPGVDDRMARQLEPFLDDWAASADTAETGAARIRGALVPLEITYDLNVERIEGPRITDPRRPVHVVREPVEHWAVSDLWGLLDGDLHPEHPGDVGTVARTQCTERAIGRYETGYGANAQDAGAARQWVCQVELIDVMARRRVDRIAFYGGPPPRQVAEGGRRIGSHPRHEIAAWLNGLPRR